MAMAAGSSADWAKPLPSIKAHHEFNFKWRNQRQVRKNRRRAHAAGKRNAFI